MVKFSPEWMSKFATEQVATEQVATEQVATEQVATEQVATKQVVILSEAKDQVSVQEILRAQNALRMT